MNVKLTLINKNYITKTQLKLGDSIIIDIANLNTTIGSSKISEAIKLQHGKICTNVGCGGYIWERSKV